MSRVTPTFNAHASQTARETSIDAKRERVTEFAQRSFERCKDQWAAKNYDRLLKRDGRLVAAVRGMGRGADADGNIPFVLPLVRGEDADAG